MLAVPWYQGDLSTIAPQPTAIPPAIGPFFRYNFNMRNSLRVHGVFYSLGAEGEVFGGVPREFSASFVDLGLDFEFNWWPYKSAWRKTKVAPYVSAGLGYSVNYTGGSVSHLYLPFGGGLKANLGKRMSGGLEISMRKNFTDAIDGGGGDGGTVNVGTEGNGSPIGNNDWYFFTGVFISYKIFEYRDYCPAMKEDTGGSKKKGSINPGTSSKRKKR